MTYEFFMMVVWAGVLATYVHMLFALWGPKYGVARLDFAMGMAHLCFGDSYDGKPPYWLGLIVLHLNGVVFALIYATLVGPLLPGSNFERGLLFGALLWVPSQMVFVPLFLREGFFAAKGPDRAWMTAIVAHGLFGAVLGWLSPVL